MTDVDVVASTAMPNGTEYRVRLVRDTDAEEPYDDGAWPIMRIEYQGNRGLWYAEEFNKQAESYVDAFGKLGEGGHATERFERYMRVFHGVTRVVTYGPNQVTDYTYIAFDPKAWREEMGVTDTSQEQPLAEVIAWLEGDVWGWVAEYRDNSSGIADEDDWQDDGSCYGFYGREVGEEAAQEQLNLMVATHKAVDRRGRASAEVIRRKLGGRLMASMHTSTDEHGNPVLTASLGPTEVTIYTSPDDGAMVVMIDSPTQSDSEHPTLRVHLNDDTIYNASVVPIEAPETEGEN
jgi:hypothetical protein